MALSQHLYDTYVQAVDPLVRVIHKPTCALQLATFHALGCGSASKDFEALLFAIYFAAITSMLPVRVVELFGCDKKAMLARYHVAVEQALSNARFLQSEELMPLQALVLFCVCSISLIMDCYSPPPPFFFPTTDGSVFFRRVCVEGKIPGHRGRSSASRCE